jgi:endonuclease YncB( thermonuclease family)
MFVTARNQRGTGKTRNGLGVRQVRQDPALFKLQDEARAEKRGLWSDMHSIPPWQWRKTHRY